VRPGCVCLEISLSCVIWQPRDRRPSILVDDQVHRASRYKRIGEQRRPYACRFPIKEGRQDRLAALLLGDGRVVDAEIAVFKNEPVERYFRSVEWQQVRNCPQERLFGCQGTGSDRLLVALLSDHVALVSDSRIDLGLEDVHPELAGRSDRHGQRVGHKLEQALVEELVGKVARWVVVEQCRAQGGELVEQEELAL